MKTDGKNHKPGCLIYFQCCVYHSDGICPGPYGKCSCGAINELQEFQDENYRKFLEYKEKKANKTKFGY